MRIALCCSLLALLPLKAFADSPFYLGLEVGSAMEDRFDELGGDIDSDNLWGGYGGYRLTDSLAVELHVNELGESSRSAILDAGFELDGTVYSLALVGAFPVHDRVDILAGVGAFRLDEDGQTFTLLGVRNVDSSDSGLMAEGGVRWHLDQTWALRASWRWYDFERADGSLIGAVEASF